MAEDRAAYFLRHGHTPEAARTLYIDFDGTLYPKVGLFDEPRPLPGAREALERFRARGFRIVVHTARLDPQYLDREHQFAGEQKGYIRLLMERDGIPFDDIVAKPSGCAYIDDLGVHFNGDWQAVADWVLFSRGDA